MAKVLTLEETIELILKNIPDYDRATVLKLIDEKRQELGPEVINDESAAMIVARELGIDLQPPRRYHAGRRPDHVGDVRSRR